MKINVNKKSYEIEDIKTDSRKVEKGDLFIAYNGVDVDGHDYISQAIEKGAILIVGEKPKDEVDDLTGKDVSYEQVSDGREFWAEACAQKYDYPQNELKVVGVTGTDGKTTTINFLYHILSEAGFKVGMISTVSARYGDKDITTGLHTTSPDPDVTFKLLRDMVDDGIEYFIIETTSHGLVHKRLHGINFIAAGVTNISPEHLDEHGTYEQLIKDKSLIFTKTESIFLSDTGMGIDEIEEHMPENKSAVRVGIYDGLESQLNEEFFSKFPGGYNLQNASLAIAIVDSLGVSFEDSIEALNTMSQVLGRYHKIPNKLGIRLIIDFAHTPNSMKEVLTAVNDSNPEGGKIITVFGCAGDRDKFKRPKMGEYSSELSDVVIVTAEDPRSEKVEDITEEVVAGNTDFEFIKIPDRQDAIAKAIALAEKGDTVIILGKGHEQSMNFNGVEHPWSDIDAVKKVLKDDYIF